MLQEHYALSEQDLNDLQAIRKERRRGTAMAAVASAASIGSGILLHNYGKKHNDNSYKTAGNSIGIVGGLFGLTALGLSTIPEIKHSYDYMSYYKLCKSKGKTPLSRKDYIEEIKKIK